MFVKGVWVMLRAFEGKGKDHSMFREKYCEDAGRVNGGMQAYIAELLLYALLIIPPAEVRPDPLTSRRGAGNSSNLLRTN